MQAVQAVQAFEICIRNKLDLCEAGLKSLKYVSSGTNKLKECAVFVLQKTEDKSEMYDNVVFSYVEVNVKYLKFIGFLYRIFHQNLSMTSLVCLLQHLTNLPKCIKLLRS